MHNVHDRSACVITQRLNASVNIKLQVPLARGCTYDLASVLSMNFMYVSLGAAPIVLPTSLPPLNRISDGIDCTPYFIAISWLSSTFSLATLTLPVIVRPICSTAGPTILHGPHHSAQKSTNTGRSDLSTSASHDFVVTWVM